MQIEDLWKNEDAEITEKAAWFWLKYTKEE